MELKQTKKELLSELNLFKRIGTSTIQTFVNELSLSTSPLSPELRERPSILGRVCGQWHIPAEKTNGHP